ncbi:hypothetical protein ABZ543_21790 [Streptomyces roseifaciens]
MLLAPTTGTQALLCARSHPRPAVQGQRWADLVTMARAGASHASKRGTARWTRTASSRSTPRTTWHLKRRGIRYRGVFPRGEVTDLEQHRTDLLTKP